jgi:hypothetical protein
MYPRFTPAPPVWVVVPLSAVVLLRETAVSGGRSGVGVPKLVGLARAIAGDCSGGGGGAPPPLNGVSMGVGGGTLVWPGVTKTAVSGSGRSQLTLKIKSAKNRKVWSHCLQNTNLLISKIVPQEVVKWHVKWQWPQGTEVA